MKYFITSLCCIFSFLSSGCVNIKVEDPMPPDSKIEVNISVWKSNVGKNNAIEQTTDATVPLNALGSEYSVEN